MLMQTLCKKGMKMKKAVNRECKLHSLNYTPGKYVKFVFTVFNIP